MTRADGQRYGSDSRLRGKIKEETFRVWFFVGLLLLGGHLALRGLL